MTNNKSRIYLAAHKNTLAPFINEKVGRSNIQESPSEISNIFLEIAHLYIKEIAADESCYWMSFVFDTCASIGMCSERYISHLTPQQKEDYIKNTLKSKTDEEVGGSALNCAKVTQRICQLSRSNLNFRQGRSNEKQITNAILDYIHVLISIDRQIDEREGIFFKTIRDSVYAQMGWQQTPVITFPAKENGSRNDSHDARIASDASQKTVEELMEEIKSLIGLDNIKEEVNSLINSLQVKQLRQSAGLVNAEVSNHMVFYGNPGTGKTTIARRLGEVYHLLGVLSKGHFIEIDRSGLVGGYLGQTALKTTEVLESALGGILFIDEAYTLSPSNNRDQYGQEAIDTILKFMEDHRDNFLVIVAGYEDLMGNFLQSNPGLKSRFNKYFHFKDYSASELSRIFISMSEGSNYVIEQDTGEHLAAIMEELVRIKTSNFGNGRTIRNLFEKSIANHANRLIREKKTDKNDLRLLTKEDILWEDMLEISR